MLNKLKIYLSGSLEFLSDYGSSWRKDISNKLINHGFCYNNILDPVNKVNLSDQLRKIKDLRRKKDYNNLHQFAKNIVRQDLRSVDLCDIFIIYISTDDNGIIPTFGSIHELIVALNQKKPIYLISSLKFTELPLWIVGLLSHNQCFEDIDTCIDSILDDIYKKDKRYVFLDYLYEK